MSNRISLSTTALSILCAAGIASARDTGQTFDAVVVATFSLGDEAALDERATVTAGAVYSNRKNFRSAGFAHGLAGASTTTTRLVADDIQADPAAAASISLFTFSMANFNTSARSARPTIALYNDVAGVPSGNAFYTITFNPVSIAASSVSLLSFGSATGPALFTIPASGKFWAGIYFDNLGGSTANTTTLLGNMGQGFFDPANVGSSADIFFRTTNSTGGVVNPIPAGSTFTSQSFNPPLAYATNFGWEFVVPTPGAITLLGLAGLAAFRRRRA